MDFDTPLVCTRTLDLDPALALSGQGVSAGVPVGERVLDAARRAVEEARDLFQPRFISIALPILERTGDCVRLSRGCLRGEGAIVRLEGAASIVAVVCTLGGGADRRVSALLDADPLLAFALDGLGSAACDRLAMDVCAEIDEAATAAGNGVTERLSPGMIGWPLREAQDQLFGLVAPEPIGVELMPSGQMIPRKSLSFVVGVGVHARAQERCTACDVQHRCRFRLNHA